MSNKNKKNKNQPSSVPQFAAEQKTKTSYLNKDVSKLQSWKHEKNPTVLVSLRFVQHDFQCFSSWSRDQMKLFWEFQERVSNISWSMVYSSGGKPGAKVGLGYTPFDASKYPKSDFKNMLSPDITLFELRVSDRMRVHGFRDESIFYVCWLDKDHEIFPV